jgi:hypothetical protein
MTVAELLQRVSAAELVEWMAYDVIEPFGESRADYRTALSTAALLNRQRGRSTPVVDPKDLIPKFDKKYLNPIDWRVAMARFKQQVK